MLLTDEEIEACAADDDGSDDMAFARAIEAAILAKLASAELPEPAIFQYDAMLASPIKAYTADQLRQAYAQGAAAQLSAEPVAARVWVGSYEGADHENQYVYSEDGDGEPLYTRRQA